MSIINGKIDWSEVLGSDTDSDGPDQRGSSLVEPRQLAVSPAVLCHVEITLTHPPHKNWLNKTSGEQTKLWHQIWNKIKESFPFPYRLSMGYVLEYHKSGHVHLHGYCQYQIPNRFSPHGMVADFAKVYLNLFKLRYNEKSMNTDYIRYRCPACCIQYVNDLENPGRFEIWKKYLLKDNDEIFK